MDTDNSIDRKIYNYDDNEKDHHSNGTILTDFNDRISSFTGPMYKDIACMIEEDKSSITTDKLFMIFIISLVIFCTCAVLYKIILYYRQMKQMIITISTDSHDT